MEGNPNNARRIAANFGSLTLNGSSAQILPQIASNGQNYSEEYKLGRNTINAEIPGTDQQILQNPHFANNRQSAVDQALRNSELARGPQQAKEEFLRLGAVIGMLDFERDQDQVTAFLKKIVAHLIPQNDCNSVCQSLVRSSPALTQRSLNSWDSFETLIHRAHQTTNVR